MGQTLYYVVIRVWPDGRQEFLGASSDDEVARRFAGQRVSMTGDYYITIQTVEEIQSDDQH